MTVRRNGDAAGFRTAAIGNRGEQVVVDRVVGLHDGPPGRAAR